MLALVVSAPAKNKGIDLSKLDFNKALSITIPYLPDDVFEERAIYFRHICCDCASTHDVIVFVRSDGLNQNWWANRFETNKRRRIKGLIADDITDGYSAEYGAP